MVKFRTSQVVLALCFFFFILGDAGANQVYIPHVTAGADDWYDYLQVDNNGLDQTSFSVILFRDGEQVQSKNYTIDGMTKLVINLKELSDQAECGMVTYLTDTIVFRLSYENNVGNGLAEFQLTENLSSSLGLYFSDYSSVLANKGLAITNMSASTANVTLYAIGVEGILDTVTFSLNKRSKIIGVHSSFFPDVAFKDLDRVIAVTHNKFLTGLTITSDPGCSKLLFMPGVDSKGLEDESVNNLENLDERVTRLLGGWTFYHSYTKVLVFQLDTIADDLNVDGHPYLYGTDVSGNKVVAEYKPDGVLGYHNALWVDDGNRRDFFLFDTDGKSITRGRHNTYVNGEDSLDSLAFTGTKHVHVVD